MSENEKSKPQVTGELREIFEPLCEAVAEVAEPEYLAAHNPEILNSVDQFAEHVLPTRHDFAILPWDAVSNYTLPSEGSPNKDLFFDIVDDWLGRHPEVEGDPDDPFEEDPKLDMIKSGLMIAMFDNTNGIGKTFAFDEANWRTYEAYMQSLPEEDREYVQGMQHNRAGNINKWWHHGHVEEMQQATEFITIHNTEVPKSHLLSNINIAVGEYGEQFARDIAQTTALMQVAAQKNVLGLAAEQTENNRAILTNYTARAAGKEPSSETTMDTLQEGILSVGQSIAIVTMQKVEGFDDPYELVQAMAKSGLVDRLARYASMGLVGPMAQAGLYLPNSLVRTSEGGVAFSDKFEEYLRDQKAKYIGEFILLAKTLELKRTDEPEPLGTICPVANMGGGINKLTHTFSRLLSFWHERQYSPTTVEA